MTDLPNLSSRAQKAFDVLSDGGQFVQRLERNSYTGREQFAYRLMHADGGIVRGIGLHAFYELQNNGLLSLYNSYSTASYYKINRAA